MANRDTREGSMKDAVGDFKKGTGELLGSDGLKREGNLDKAEGKVQKTFGRIRDALRGKDKA